VETVSWRTRADQGESAENAETALQPVEDLGVGNRIARKLNVLGIKTALDLALTNPAFIRKNFSVVLERTVRELNGESCLRGKPLRRNSKLSAAAVLA
jgi:nucleotidyltransferase/DNA polymerase involved in DNA repair